MTKKRKWLIVGIVAMCLNVGIFTGSIFFYSYHHVIFPKAQAFDIVDGGSMGPRQPLLIEYQYWEDYKQKSWSLSQKKIDTFLNNKNNNLIAFGIPGIRLEFWEIMANVIHVTLDGQSVPVRIVDGCCYILFENKTATHSVEVTTSGGASTLATYVFNVEYTYDPDFSKAYEQAYDCLRRYLDLPSGQILVPTEANGPTDTNSYTMLGFTFKLCNAGRQQSLKTYVVQGTAIFTRDFDGTIHAVT